MSYILDALKKVEHEKARKTNSGGVTRISGDLFQKRKTRPSRGGAWKIASVIVIVSLGTFATTWFVLKSDKKKVAVTAVTPVTAPTLQPGQPAIAASPAPLPPSPAQQVDVQPSPAPSASPPVITKPAAPVLSSVERVSGNEKKMVKTASAGSQTSKSVVQTIPPPSDIKVSGIAWQEEPALRRAVVNGFLLQEGATVSGAKILEIHQGSVRFSSPAGIFDAILHNTKGI